jgi:hypothetical protein
MTFNFDAVVEAPGADRAVPSADAPVEVDDVVPRRRVLLVGHPNVGKSVVFALEREIAVIVDVTG